MYTVNQPVFLSRDSELIKAVVVDNRPTRVLIDAEMPEGIERMQVLPGELYARRETTESIESTEDLQSRMKTAKGFKRLRSTERDW